VLGVVILHEAVHGLAFWALGRKRPVFGWKWLFAYAACPDATLSKGQMILVGLAPLIILSGFGLAMCSFAPVSWLLAILFAMIDNAAGAAGDIVISVWLLTRPQGSRILDLPSSMFVFRPLATSHNESVQGTGEDAGPRLQR
jgi:hypothetical protein